MKSKGKLKITWSSTVMKQNQTKGAVNQNKGQNCPRSLKALVNYFKLAFYKITESYYEIFKGQYCLRSLKAHARTNNYFMIGHWI